MTTECSIVRDLLPLYVEGLVSEETSAYIEAHLAACPACNAERDALSVPAPAVEPPPGEEEIAPLKKIRKRLNLRLHSVVYLALIFFALFGFSLTEGADLMYNSLIMPLVGILGYLAFGWRAVYKVPLLLLVVDGLAVLMHLVGDVPALDMIAFTLIYTIFALVGVTIAHLIHLAFRRDKA